MLRLPVQRGQHTGNVPRLEDIQAVTAPGAHEEKHRRSQHERPPLQRFGDFPESFYQVALPEQKVFQNNLHRRMRLHYDRPFSSSCFG